MALRTGTRFHVVITVLMVFLGLRKQELHLAVSSSPPAESERWFFSTDKTNQRRSDTPIGWSEWSLWGICSRSCDGGVTYQIRQCLQKTGCRGDSIRYRICNMQPCKDRSDFRAMQCKAYDNRPYRGRLYDWKPFHDPEDPCSLTCQAKSFLFVAKLAHKAQDGTRCRKGSLDMCVWKGVHGEYS
ncbi:ADAMTS-like protein 1 [Tachypleus tridentatus]|uniref:ADAMTS-like protein 1 n=1 Tax=Tachypleus tridentatus TaxID=6853 RepID=UPI003FD45C2D